MNGEIRWRELEYGALRRRRRQLCCQAVGERGGSVSAGKTGIAQREIARMNGKPRPGEPAGGLAQSEARPQSFGDDGCRSFGAGVEARDGMLGAGEGGEQRMRIIGRRSRLPAWRRAGRRLFVFGLPYRPEQEIIVVITGTGHGFDRIA